MTTKQTHKPRVTKWSGRLELEEDRKLTFTNWAIDADGEPDYRLAILDAIIALLQEERGKVAGTQDNSIVVELGDKP